MNDKDTGYQKSVIPTNLKILYLHWQPFQLINTNMVTII